jgi:hypothetical protein
MKRFGTDLPSTLFPNDPHRQRIFAEANRAVQLGAVLCDLELGDLQALIDELDVSTDLARLIRSYGGGEKPRDGFRQVALDVGIKLKKEGGWTAMLQLFRWFTEVMGTASAWRLSEVWDEIEEERN